MTSRMKGLLILAVVLVSSFGVPVSATNYHEEAEFQRSMARYRQFFEQEDTAAIMRTLLQVDEKVKENLGSAGEENFSDPDSEKDNSSENPNHTKQDHLEEQQQNVEKILEEDRDPSTEENVKVKDQEEDVDEFQLGPVEESPKENPQQKISNEGVDPDQQQQQESLEKDVKLEQESGEQAQEEGLKEGEKKEKETENEERFVLPDEFPEPYFLGPKIEDWDEQRAEWLEKNPHHQRPVGGKPKVLIVTGSQPYPCRSSVGDHFHIQSLKLKMDYARMHNYELFYSMAWLDPLFNSFWVKLPIVRKLMLTHPEIEWFFWLDSDAVFTDMLFEAPFHTYEGINMVMWGWNDGLYRNKLWTAFNAGVFILRNCQWSLDLIDKWSPMGPDGAVREASGRFLTDFLSGRKQFASFPADDQSALAYLLIIDEAVRSKVKLVEHNEYLVSGWWVDTVPLYYDSMEKYHPGLGDYRWPFITHFTGCSPCGGKQGSHDYEECMGSFNTAFNFADNQVLAFMGYQHESLSSPNVTCTRHETGRPLEFVDFNPWEKRIAQVAAAAIS